MSIGNIIFYGVTAAVLGIVVFGVWSVVHWWNNSEYEGYLAGGDDWLAKGYLTDAEIQYKKAKAIFPKDPRTKDAFARLNIAREDKKRRGGAAPNAILGPIAPPSVMSAEAQHKMMQAQMSSFNKRREIERYMREEEMGRPPATTTKVKSETLKSRERRAEEARLEREARRKEGEAFRAEQEAKRIEAQRLEDEERKRKLDEARKKAAEQERLAEERRAAEKELAQKRTDQVNLKYMNSWLTGLLRQSASSYRSRSPWTRSSDADTFVASVKRGLANDAQSEAVTIKTPYAYKRIPVVTDVEGLKSFYQSVSRLTLEAGDAEVAGRNAKVVARNQLNRMVRDFEKLDREETALERSRESDAMTKKMKVRSDKSKLAARMRTQCNAYLEGLNRCRGAKAAKQMLLKAKEMTSARLQELGADQPTATETATAPATKASKTKTYVLKNGNEIKGIKMGAMGDRLLIKDDAGKMHNVSKLDVKVIK